MDPTNYDRPEEAISDFATEIDPSILYLEMLIGGGKDNMIIFYFDKFLDALWHVRLLLFFYNSLPVCHGLELINSIDFMSTIKQKT